MEIISRKEAKNLGLKRYFIGNPCLYGHVSPRRTDNGACLVCCSIRSREKYWEDIEKSREKNRKHEANNAQKRRKAKRDRRNKLKEKSRLELWLHDTLTNIKSRARAKKLDFNLTKEDLNIPKYCPVLNLKLEISNGCSQDNSPSIDRIDNNKGYIKNNICIISWRANKLKRDATPEELDLLAEYAGRKALDRKK